MEGVARSDQEDSFGCSGERRQKGGKVRGSIDLTRDSRGCEGAEMVMARRLITKVDGSACKAGASNESGTARVE